MKTALVLHGWPEHNLENYFLVKWLEDKEYKVLTPDLFRHGLVPELNEKIDLIVGISMGGLVLPQVAKKTPEGQAYFYRQRAVSEIRFVFFQSGIVFAEKQIV